LACRTLRPASVAAFAVLILGVLLSTSLVFPAVGVKYYPGLQAGNSAFYSISGNYGYIPTVPVTQMKVLSVSGTNASVSFVNFFPDGHISPNFWIDVFSGQRYNFTSLFFFVVASGLQKGDGIYNGWSNVTIVAADTSICGGVARATVGTQFLFFGTDQQVRLAWDQATGLLCGYSIIDQNGSGKSLGLSMINSTIWSQPATAVDPFTVGAEISALLGLPLVAIILFVYFRRKRAKRYERPPGNR
jgi:hypothetical protein